MKTKLALSFSALALLAATAPASAGSAPVGNHITLHLGPTQGLFRGAVKSDVLECIADRKVRIVLIQGPSVGPDMRVGKGHTDSRGHYHIQTDEQSGNWFAHIKREKLGNGLECDSAQSRVRGAG
jgi:hypothetical protein